MPKLRDLTGQIFKNVLVESRAPNKRVSQRTTFVMWNCKCLLCGNSFVSRGNNLTSGNTTSCGCNNKECVSKAQLIDLTGQQIFNWYIENRAPDHIRPNGDHKVMWTCLCACGTRRDVLAEKLLNGESKSCGCYRRELASKRYTEDLTGIRFGHLLVLERVSKPGQVVKWKCLCDCGNIVIVRATSLKRGDTQSCGCKKFSIGAEKVALSLKENNIKYKPEYKFKDLYTGNKHYLRFDFGLIDKNNNLLGLIEYQGQQHFEERINKEFGKIQREVTDPMKKEYCKNNKIPLFEIRFDENIEEKVNFILTELNLKHVNPVPSSI